MGKFILFSGAVALILVCTLVWAPPTEAYEFYRNGGANCSTCHPGFTGGTSDTLHQLHTGFTSDCNACHITGAGDTPVPTHFDPPAFDVYVGCVGCHGRDPGTGANNDWAAGLRLHHEISGITECLSCHPNDPTPIPEDIPPSYYGDPSITSQTDSCADNLDNDGDDLYDDADPDCQDGGVCGDGILDPGEECDDGNNDPGDCCAPDCTFEPSGSACGDPSATQCDNPDSCDGQGMCLPNYEPPGTPCDDGEFCTVDESCDGGGVCGGGVPLDCSDGVGCTEDSCNEVSDVCVNDPNDALCDNGQFCDGLETCDPQLDCQPGTPVECPPGETCNEDTDQCEPDAGCTTDADCDDGLFCNGTETCDTSTNECQAGTAPDCDDGVGCTVDSCNEGTDSCDNLPDDASCDNGFFCDGAEFCDPLLDCQPGIPVDCDDGVGCTDDSCDEVNDFCVNNPNDANCTDDGMFCTGSEICDPFADCVSTGDPCLPEEICNEEDDICEPVGGPIEVEIEVPGAINANNNGKTPIHIEFPDSNGDTQVEIAELYCGGDVSGAMATPWRINVEDDEENEFVALFKTRDLMLVCEDTVMICVGALADGTAFAGMDDLRVVRDADGRCGTAWGNGKIRRQR